MATRLEDLSDVIEAIVKAKYLAVQRLLAQGLPVQRGAKEIAFEIDVIIPGGLNAIPRIQRSEAIGEQITEDLLPDIRSTSVQRRTDESKSTEAGEAKKEDDSTDTSLDSSVETSVDTDSATSHNADNESNHLAVTRNSQDFLTRESYT